MKTTSKTTNNRTAMPSIAAVVDEFKALFGEQWGRVTYAAENGVVLGKPSTDRGIKLGDMIIGPIESGKAQK